jgi:HSP90 family molecular chaperone
VELLRELVNNAYDADAIEVRLAISEEEVTVEDNGSGMDLEGLKQYFNIGSPEKRLHRRSSRFGRDRIGEFGIGKFASLSAAQRFEVWTKKGTFQATYTAPQ